MKAKAMIILLSFNVFLKYHNFAIFLMRYMINDSSLSWLIIIHTKHRKSAFHVTKKMFFFHISLRFNCTRNCTFHCKKKSSHFLFKVNFSFFDYVPLRVLYTLNFDNDNYEMWFNLFADVIHCGGLKFIQAKSLLKRKIFNTSLVVCNRITILINNKVKYLMLVCA